MEKETVTAKKAVVKTAPVAEKVAPVATKIEVPKKVLKSKVYKLLGTYADSPWLKLQSEDRPASGFRLLYFDEEKGIKRAIRYVENIASPFVDDQLEYVSKGGELARSQVIFEGGMIGAGANEVALKNFLDVHPWNKRNGGGHFYEHDEEVIATEDVKNLRLEAEAMKVALDADINTASALLRPRHGQEIHTMKTDMITRELILMAKRDPEGLLEAAGNNNLMVNYLAYTSLDFGICKLTDNGTVYRWASNSEKLLSIAFGEDPMQAITNYFTTDEGIQVMSKITNKLKK